MKRSLSDFSRDKKTEILYNEGLQLLLTGNPGLAFKCLHEAALSHKNKPKLWLRLAECCVAAHLHKVRN